MKSDVLVIIAFLSELRKNPQIVLQFNQPISARQVCENHSSSG
jgi:hypothetical protein